jgi:ketosteroid isomerase-like protein
MLSFAGSGMNGHFCCQRARIGLVCLLGILLLTLVGACRLGIHGSNEDAVGTLALRQVTDGYWQALRDQDQKRFQQFCTDDWVLCSGWGNKFDIPRLFAMHRVDIKDFRISISNFQAHPGRDMAWATYDADMSCLDRGTPWGGHFLVTNIYRKFDGRWKCVHMHESVKH